MWPFKTTPEVDTRFVPTDHQFESIVEQATQLLLAGDEQWDAPFGPLQMGCAMKAHTAAIARALKRARKPSI